LRSKPDLDSFSARVSEETQQVSSTVAHSHVTQVALLTEIKEQTVMTEQTSQEIKLAVQSLLENGDSGLKCLAGLLQPALEKVISDRLESALKSMKDHDVHNKTGSRTSVRSQVKENVTSSSPSTTVGVTSLSSLSSTRTARTWKRETKFYKFWFGRLRIITSISEQWDGRGISGYLRRAEVLETEVMFLPSPWILRKGVVFNVKRIISAVTNPQPQFSLRPLRIITSENEVFDAILSSSLSQVRSLIDRGLVHPQDVFPDGSCLPYYCLYIIHTEILPDDEDIWEKLMMISISRLSAIPMNSIRG
jgi:hypothetical protein